MNELELAYAALGRKQCVIESQDAAYGNLLAILAGVISGEISRDRLLLNMTARTWHLAAPGERPAMPATINGLPVCIIAPAEPGMPSEAEPG